MRDLVEKKEWRPRSLHDLNGYFRMTCWCGRKFRLRPEKTRNVYSLENYVGVCSKCQIQVKFEIEDLGPKKSAVYYTEEEDVLQKVRIP